ncbi:MAG: hypothetical protein ACQEQL_05575 [Pseudomonadota bacterium]
MTLQRSCFAELGNPSRLWVISALHGQTARLNSLHMLIWQNFQPGDKIVYLGNYLGSAGPQGNPDVIDSLILFKQAAMNEFSIDGNDVVFLRGVNEEMWQKLLQLQFANRPYNVLQWLLSQNIEGILNHYGTTGAEGLAACRGGINAITRWTNDLRTKLRARTGHDQFYQSLKRAAHSHNRDTDNRLLFVHAGLDQNRPLRTQQDSFWWGAHKFDTIDRPYDPFRFVIRGYDPENKGVLINDATISLDGGACHGGPLLCTQMTANGQIIDIYSA